MPTRKVVQILGGDLRSTRCGVGDPRTARPAHSLYMEGTVAPPIVESRIVSIFMSMERYQFDREASVFYVTFTIVEWLPIFVTLDTLKIITESLNFCHENKGLRTNAYVMMPTHLHAILFHESFKADQLESVVNDFRKFTGRRLADYCDDHMPQCFRQELRDKSGADRDRRVWQPSRHPEIILTEGFWKQKLDYMHANPCRKGLVHRATDWRFSSANAFFREKPIPNDVILSPLHW